MDAARGLQCIAWRCLVQVVAAYPQVIADGSPKAVHQTRVAIRRLRAAMSLFRKVSSDEAANLLRDGFKAAASALAPARDLHVRAALLADAAKAGGQDATEAMAQLAARQRAATQAAAQMLAGLPFQTLLLHCATWIEALDEARRPLDSFAAQALSRRRRRLLRHGHDLAAMDDAARHALRIDVKKLRYATDFLAAVFPGEMARRRRARMSRTLTTLQDCLGDLNDRAIAARESRELGRLLAIDERARQRTLGRAQRALDRLYALPAWWKAD